MFINLLILGDVMLQLIHISEGLRMFKRSIYVKKHGVKKYKGSDIEICKQILEDCYDPVRKYFKVSAGHFQTFYCRDFGWIVQSLLNLGYKEKVGNTLSYALKQFARHGKVCTSINNKGKPFDFPNYAVDSLAYLLYSLSCLGDMKLVSEYKDFLQMEVDKFFSFVVDKKTGLVRSDYFFSSMKDHSKRRSSCYDNCMLYLVQQACDKLGFVNPLEKYNYNELIIDNFWEGEYFLDDMSKKKYLAGDANVFAFWTGVIDDNKKLKKVVATIRKKGLDAPFPLRYTSKDVKGVKLRLFDLFASGYEASSVWCHMGPLYIDIVGKVDKKLQKKYLFRYKQIILKYQNFLELFEGNGEPFSSFFYYADERMSWCANYLALCKTK